MGLLLRPNVVNPIKKKNKSPEMGGMNHLQMVGLWQWVAHVNF